MSTIVIDAKHLETVQRTVMDEVVRDLERAAETIRSITERPLRNWPLKGLKSSDARTAVTLLRETLDALDALGWPLDDGDLATTVT
jgi:hypothetical protein